MDSEKTEQSDAVKSVVHTPGPWKVPKRFDIYQDLGPNVGGTYIGTTAGNRVLPESVARVDEANARLMAAAPELLEAIKRLQAAIGEHCCSNCITEEDLENEGSDLLIASKAADAVLAKVV